MTDFDFGTATLEKEAVELPKRKASRKTGEKFLNNPFKSILKESWEERKEGEDVGKAMAMTIPADKFKEARALIRRAVDEAGLGAIGPHPTDLGDGNVKIAFAARKRILRPRKTKVDDATTSPEAVENVTPAETPTEDPAPEVTHTPRRGRRGNGDLRTEVESRLGKGTFA